MGEAPQRAAAAGLPWTRLSGGGPATIVWSLVAQRNQRIDRPPFDLVTPSPNPAGTVGTTQSGGGATCHRGRPWYTGVPEVAPGPCMGDPGHRVLLTPDGLGSEGESDLLAMPGELAGQPVPGSQSESLRRHPARTSGGFGNSGTSEKGDKPSGRPTTPTRSAAPTAGLCPSRPAGPLATTLRDGHHAGLATQGR